MLLFPCLQIYYYANSIYSSAGVEENNIQYVTVGTGAVNVFMTIAAVGAFLLKDGGTVLALLDCIEGDSSRELFVSLTHQVFIVEASGRRLLLLCGFGICCGACVLLTVALNLQVQGRSSRFDPLQPKSSTLLPSTGSA